MLLGEHLHNLDAKGRLIIPSKFRDDLGQTFVATKGLDGCLFLFPMKEWEKLSEKLNHLPLARQKARAFTRFFFSSANELECDKQGRIALPSSLKDYAGLNKEVRIIGVHNRIELWSEDRWSDYQEQEAAEESFEQLAELMEDFDVGF